MQFFWKSLWLKIAFDGLQAIVFLLPSRAHPRRPASVFRLSLPPSLPCMFYFCSDSDWTRLQRPILITLYTSINQAIHEITYIAAFATMRCIEWCTRIPVKFEISRTNLSDICELFSMQWIRERNYWMITCRELSVIVQYSHVQHRRTDDVMKSHNSQHVINQ